MITLENEEIAAARVCVTRAQEDLDMARSDERATMDYLTALVNNLTESKKTLNVLLMQKPQIGSSSGATAVSATAGMMTGAGGLEDVPTKGDIRLIIRNELRTLKLKHNTRLPRSASETSTAVTPVEPALVVEGRGVVNAGVVDNAHSYSVEGALKDAQEYYILLRDHIHCFGEANYQAVIRKKSDVIIKHKPFDRGIQEVVFPYTSSSVKNHWIAFSGFEYDCGAYFTWAFDGNIAEGREGEPTPPSADFEA